jgi:hypothetical protein
LSTLSAAHAAHGAQASLWPAAAFLGETHGPGWSSGGNFAVFPLNGSSPVYFGARPVAALPPLPSLLPGKASKGSISVMGTAGPGGQEAGFGVSYRIPTAWGDALVFFNVRQDGVTAEALPGILTGRGSAQRATLSGNLGLAYSVSDGVALGSGLMLAPHTSGGSVPVSRALAAAPVDVWAGLGWRADVTFEHGRITQVRINGVTMTWDSFLQRAVAPRPVHPGANGRRAAPPPPDAGSTSIAQHMLAASMPSDPESSRRMFSRHGVPSGLDRVAAFAYMTYLRAGQAPERAFDWVMDGQRHRGGLQKLIEQGTPRAPDWVGLLDFQREGMGPEASAEAMAVYRMLRQPHSLDNRAQPAQGPTPAWQAVFDVYLRGLFSGGHAGGLKALQGLRARLLVRPSSLPAQGVGPVDLRDVSVADFLDRGFRPGDARLAHWLFQRWTAAGHPPPAIMDWITSSYFTAQQGQGNTAALIKRALAASPMPNEVQAESFRNLGMDGETARLAHQAYLLQRSRGHEPAAAWQSVLIIYLSGLHGAGVHAAQERFRQLLLPLPVSQRARAEPVM